MSTNRFAAWATGTQTSVESTVTRVTRVTTDQDPRISAGLTHSQAVTQTQEHRVTRVTGAEVVTHVTQAPGLGLRGKTHEVQSCNPCNPRNPQNSYEPHVSDDDFEERAALIEEGSGAPREWAEAFAGLDATRPPADIPPARWQQFVDDGGRILDQWAAQAKALGWSPLELFGCDRPRPLARTDNTGLIWLLRGRRLLALTAETATIENKNAPPHKYRRCINEPGRAALAWELLS